jgi:hypothetical protein
MNKIVQVGLHPVDHTKLIGAIRQEKKRPTGRIAEQTRCWFVIGRLDFDQQFLGLELVHLFH